MESVAAFNSELSGLYDSKPPISKAKMASITRAAMKAIKFYKHVVQSVEKFILKCKPEYKIPGLYVIDSIVRQSRHQFGPEKDVFAPRFARNIKQTFANLFRCSPEDKSRIIRVLNLWQKNSVFAPEVIQPLFDLADPNNPIYQTLPPVNSSMDISTSSNGLNTSGDGSSHDVEDSHSKSVDLTAAGNNLTQLLKDPNVLRQLQTLQKLKQQEEKQNKLNEMRLQEEAFEKHLQNVLKGNSGVSGMQSVGEGGEKEVEFISNDGSKIEVINLDGNDSRSPTPDRDRYNKRRRSSRSRSPRDGRGRDRRRRSSRSRSRSPRSRSRGGSRSPRSNRRRGSRERDRGKDKEREKEKDKEKEYERERRRKGLPDIKKEHLSVCSTTLWVGHLSKLVQQEELSDTFGKYGDIVSIDMIHPRGCAFIVMNRRQDAHKAMGGLKNYKMQGRAITISWAAGKGVKSKEWKDYWDLDLGVSYIPWNRLSVDTDLTSLEEGGMFDEDSMPDWMKDKLNQKKDVKDKALTGGIFGIEGLPSVDTSQPPPNAGAMMPGVPMVPPFSIGPVPRLMPPMGVPLPGNMVPGMVPGIPMPPNVVTGMPPPHMLPPGGMMPGFGPIPPPMDKTIPPPNAGPSDNAPMPFMGNMGIPPMQHQPPFSALGMPPQFNQQQANQLASSNIGNQNDDHMDIEMEDEVPMNPKPPTTINFNQPPPLFQPPNFNMPDMPGMGNDRKNDQDSSIGRDNNHRERNEFPNQRERGSRWGNERSLSRERDMPPRDRNDNMNEGRPDFNRRGPHEQMNENPPQIWRENGPGPNFQHPNFGDRRGPGGPGGPGGPNILGMDMQNAPPHHRPPHEFFDGRREDFGMDDRRGNGQQRDFFQNQGNRFAPQQMGPGMGRGAQMPMRGGPPQPPFGPRLGPMFIRGPARPGPPGFNFGNDRPPFERDDRGGGSGNNGGRMRGGNNNMDRRQGNWRDDDEGRRGNRFHNRDRDNDRNRDEPKGRDRHDRDNRDHSWNDRKNERKVTPPPPPTHGRIKSFGDTEEDWDKELVDHSESPPAAPTSQRGNKRSESKSEKKSSLDTEEDWDEELVEHKVTDDHKTSSDNTHQETAPSDTNNQDQPQVPEQPPNNEDKQVSINKFTEEPKVDIPDKPAVPVPEPQSENTTKPEEQPATSEEPGEVAATEASTS